MKGMSDIGVARLRKKGEFTLPKEIRERMGWDEGDHLKVKMVDNHLIVEKIS